MLVTAMPFLDLFTFPGKSGTGDGLTTWMVRGWREEHTRSCAVHAGAALAANRGRRFFSSLVLSCYGEMFFYQEAQLFNMQT